MISRSRKWEQIFMCILLFTFPYFYLKKLFKLTDFYLKKEIEIFHQSIFSKGNQINLFFSSRSERRMVDQPDTLYLDKNLFDRNKSEKRSWSCIGCSCSRSFIVFCLNFSLYCYAFWEASGEYT